MDCLSKAKTVYGESIKKKKKIVKKTWIDITMYDTRCGILMVERPRNDVSDGKSWKCPQCKTRNSIREVFFPKSRMSLQKWL